MSELKHYHIAAIIVMDYAWVYRRTCRMIPEDIAIDDWSFWIETYNEAMELMNDA